MPRKYLEAIRLPDQDVNPMFAFLGMEIVQLEPNRAVISMEVIPTLIQGAGFAAGGIIATLLDETMAHAVLGGNSPGEFTTTVDLSVKYLRAVHKGDLLTCEAHVIKRGSRICFAEASICVMGKDVARASASFLML